MDYTFNVEIENTNVQNVVERLSAYNRLTAKMESNSPVVFTLAVSNTARAFIIQDNDSVVCELKPVNHDVDAKDFTQDIGNLLEKLMQIGIKKCTSF